MILVGEWHIDQVIGLHLRWIHVYSYSSTSSAGRRRTVAVRFKLSIPTAQSIADSKLPHNPAYQWTRFTSPLHDGSMDQVCLHFSHSLVSLRRSDYICIFHLDSIYLFIISLILYFRSSPIISPLPVIYLIHSLYLLIYI